MRTSSILKNPFHAIIARNDAFIGSIKTILNHHYFEKVPTTLKFCGHNIELSCHPETEPHAKLLQVNDQSVTPHLGDSSNDLLYSKLFQSKARRMFLPRRRFLEELQSSVCLLRPGHMDISQFTISISYFLDPLQTDLSANISGHMVTED